MDIFRPNFPFVSERRKLTTPVSIRLRNGGIGTNTEQVAMLMRVARSDHRRSLISSFHRRSSLKFLTLLDGEGCCDGHRKTAHSNVLRLSLCPHGLAYWPEPGRRLGPHCARVLASELTATSCTSNAVQRIGLRSLGLPFAFDPAPWYAREVARPLSEPSRTTRPPRQRRAFFIQSLSMSSGSSSTPDMGSSATMRCMTANCFAEGDQPGFLRSRWIERAKPRAHPLASATTRPHLNNR